MVLMVEVDPRLQQPWKRVLWKVLLEVLKQEENFEAIVADKFEGDGGVIETEIGEKQKMPPLMKTDSIMRNEECTLDEEPQEGVDEKEANISNMSASWRDSSKNYDDFEDDDE